jgi:hypothetical protein
VKSQDTLEMKTHMSMFYPYDFVINSHAFPCKYRYNNTYKYSYTSSIQSGDLWRIISVLWLSNLLYMGTITLPLTAAERRTLS